MSQNLTFYSSLLSAESTKGEILRTVHDCVKYSSCPPAWSEKETLWVHPKNALVKPSSPPHTYTHTAHDALLYLQTGTLQDRYSSERLYPTTDRIRCREPEANIRQSLGNSVGKGGGRLCRSQRGQGHHKKTYRIN